MEGIPNSHISGTGEINSRGFHLVVCTLDNYNLVQDA